MKIIVAAFLLSALPAAAEQERGIGFDIGVGVPVTPDLSARANFDGETLVVSSAKKEIHRERLPKTEVAKIRKILESAKEDEWSAYYFHMGVLDGSVIRFTATHGDKDLDFEGWNGAPPGFHALVALINERCGRAVLHIQREKTLLRAKRFRNKAEFENHILELDGK